MYTHMYIYIYTYIHIYIYTYINIYTYVYISATFFFRVSFQKPKYSGKRCTCWSLPPVASSPCCSVLQCVAVCCSVLQCVAVCCSMLQCVAMCCRKKYSYFEKSRMGRLAILLCCSVLQCVAVCCSVLQCVAICCSVLQCAAVRCSVLQCVAVCCSALQCAAVCCSVLQCVAVCCRSVPLAQSPPSAASSQPPVVANQWVMSHVRMSLFFNKRIFTFFFLLLLPRSRLYSYMCLHISTKMLPLLWRHERSIWIKHSGNPRSTSNQSSKPCTVLQYPSRNATLMATWQINESCHTYEWVFFFQETSLRMSPPPPASSQPPVFVHVSTHTY